MENRKLKPKEKVVVFGQEVSGSNKHDDNGVVFGVVLLLAGTIFLLNTLGFVTWDIWQDLVKYWPLLLILGGVQIILGKNLLARLISFVLSVAVLGTAVIYVMQTRSPEILKFVPKKVTEWSDFWDIIGR